MEGVTLKIFFSVVEALSPIIGGAVASLLVALVVWIGRKFKVNFSADRRARYRETVAKHVRKVYQTYVRGLKDAADHNGKLTKDEAKHALEMATKGISGDLTGWYRKTRDEIKEDVESFIGGLKIAKRLSSGNPSTPE